MLREFNLPPDVTLDDIDPPTEEEIEKKEDDRTQMLDDQAKREREDQ